MRLLFLSAVLISTTLGLKLIGVEIRYPNEGGVEKIPCIEQKAINCFGKNFPPIRGKEGQLCFNVKFVPGKFTHEVYMASVQTCIHDIQTTAGERTFDLTVDVPGGTKRFPVNWKREKDGVRLRLGSGEKVFKT
ncbi:hypothetical protein CRM22_001846, partial [Opisthorchis felineus]